MKPSLFVLVLILFAQVGCNSSDPGRLYAGANEDAYIYCDDIRISLLESGAAKPASLKNAEIKGRLSVADEEKIAALVGRIPNISHEIEALSVISVPDEEAVVIAWVLNYEVKLNKTKGQTWHILSLIHSNS